MVRMIRTDGGNYINPYQIINIYALGEDVIYETSIGSFREKFTSLEHAVSMVELYLYN